MVVKVRIIIFEVHILDEESKILLERKLMNGSILKKAIVR